MTRLYEIMFQRSSCKKQLNLFLQLPWESATDFCCQRGLKLASFDTLVKTNCTAEFTQGTKCKKPSFAQRLRHCLLWAKRLQAVGRQLLGLGDRQRLRREFPLVLNRQETQAYRDYVENWPPKEQPQRLRLLGTKKVCQSDVHRNRRVRKQEEFPL